MAANATPSKIEATRAYGAEVVLHGSIWDEANEKAQALVRERGFTYIHPFDDLQLIGGQGTVGLEIFQDWPDVDVVVVPIGGGGLISGIALALKSLNPKVRVIGVESSGAPGMKRSVDEGQLVTLDRVDCVIDGLRVKRVGEKTFEIVRQYVDDIVTLPDEQIFDAVVWTMHHTKLVPEGAAAAPVGALLHGLVKAPAGARVACVLSGGNVNLDQLKGLRWN
jgi:threonine dehydratase